MHVIYWASGLVLLGTQLWLTFAQRDLRSANTVKLEIVWAVVPALFLVGLGFFGSER